MVFGPALPDHFLNVLSTAGIVRHLAENMQNFHVILVAESHEDRKCQGLCLARWVERICWGGSRSLRGPRLRTRLLAGAEHNDEVSRSSAPGAEIGSTDLFGFNSHCIRS